MKEQNRANRQDHHSAEGQGRQAQRSGQRGGQREEDHQPGSGRHSGSGHEHKRGRRNIPFVTLDKDDIY